MKMKLGGTLKWGKVWHGAQLMLRQMYRSTFLTAWHRQPLRKQCICFYTLTMLYLQVSVMTTTECWFLERQTFHGPLTLPSGDGICFGLGESCPQFSTCADHTLLTLPQIWEENLHSAARGARPIVHVQAPPGLHTQQSHRVRLHKPGQENRWILWGRYQHHCQRCSHAARSQGPVSNTLQAGKLSVTCTC